MSERLFTVHHVEEDEIARCLLENWNLKLGKRIKASQNHTFEASPADDDDTATASKFAVRVTPDAEGKNKQRILDELSFVNFLVEDAKLEGVCRPIAATKKGGDDNSNTFLVNCGTHLICVSSWAEGVPLELYGAFRWMDEDLVRAQGQWLAKMHQASIAFSKNHPEIVQRMRRWDEIHHAVMKGTPISEEDAQALTQWGQGENNDKAGIIHGDLNLSNFFVVEGEPAVRLSVFDWDQVHFGWFENDLAQSSLSSLMLSEGGAVPGGEPVPQVNPGNFQKWIVEGYKSIRGPDSIDWDRFQRMIQLRKSFYGKFCKRAKEEGDIPADMAVFIAYVNRWIARG